MQRLFSRTGRSIGAVLLLGSSGLALADGNVLGTVGYRSLNDALWESAGLDRQMALGVSADFGLRDLPLYLSTGLQLSGDEATSDSGGDVSGAVFDVSLGLKLMPNDGSIRPYLGAGFARVGAAIDFSLFQDDDDQSFGYYVNGGLHFRVAGHFTLGLDVRYVGGTGIEIRGVKGDADSLTTSVLIGYSWGD